jgi:hypothetical protein
MRARNTTLAAAIMTLLAFVIAGLVSVWKLAADGPRPFTLIPAICFPIAAAVWLFLLFRRHERATHDEL